MDDFALTPAERRLFEALNAHGVRYLVVGLERIDTVLTAHGLDSFAAEYDRALDFGIDGIPIRVLPLDRIIHSKRSTGRPKDLAALPALEATLAARGARESGDPSS